MADYIVRVADVEDKQKIFEVCARSYFPDMPLYEAVGVTKHFGVDDFPELKTIDQKLTLIAVSKDGEIMGFAINIMPNFDESDNPFLPISLFVAEDTKGMLSVIEKTMMEHRIMCVDRKWRGKGVAKRLVEESENLAKSLRMSIYAAATGAHMEAALKSRGWECIYRLNYKDYAKHEKSFTAPEEPNTSLTLYQKLYDDN